MLPLPSGCRSGVLGQRRGDTVQSCYVTTLACSKTDPPEGFIVLHSLPSCGGGNSLLHAGMPPPPGFLVPKVLVEVEGHGEPSRGVGAQGSDPLGLFPEQGGMLPRRREGVPKQLLKRADNIVLDIVRFASPSGSLFKISPAVRPVRSAVRGHTAAAGAPGALPVVTGAGRRGVCRDRSWAVSVVTGAGRCLSRQEQGRAVSGAASLGARGRAQPVGKGGNDGGATATPAGRGGESEQGAESCRQHLAGTVSQLCLKGIFNSGLVFPNIDSFPAYHLKSEIKCYTGLFKTVTLPTL